MCSSTIYTGSPTPRHVLCTRDFGAGIQLSQRSPRFYQLAKSPNPRLNVVPETLQLKSKAVPENHAGLRLLDSREISEKILLQLKIPVTNPLHLQMLCNPYSRTTVFPPSFLPFFSFCVMSVNPQKQTQKKYNEHKTP
jgi:hypothetical protein